MTIDDDDAVRLNSVELAKAIHWDDGKGKREKKERGGGSVCVGNNNDTPSFAVG